MILKEFDSKSHELLTLLFDAAEEKLVSRGVCQSTEASFLLTMAYIKECGEFLENGIAFLKSEGVAASWMFIGNLAGSIGFKRIGRRDYQCAQQLLMHSALYFPEFYKALTVCYANKLQAAKDANEIQSSGILMMAAAMLPGARTELRRELRRRGLNYDRTLAPDDVMRLRLGSLPCVTPALEFEGQTNE